MGGFLAPLQSWIRLLTRACLLCNVYVQCAAARLTDSLGRCGTGRRSVFSSALCFLLTPLFTYETSFCSSFWSLFSLASRSGDDGGVFAGLFLSPLCISPHRCRCFPGRVGSVRPGPHRCRRLPTGSSDSPTVDS